MVPHIVIISINDNMYQIYSKEQTTMNLVKCDICQLNSTKLASVYQIEKQHAFVFQKQCLVIRQVFDRMILRKYERNLQLYACKACPWISECVFAHTCMCIYTDPCISWGRIN